MKFATLYVAAGRGLFQKYGLDVDLEQVKSGTEAIAFLTQGSVDVGGIEVSPDGSIRVIDLRAIPRQPVDEFERWESRL